MPARRRRDADLRLLRLHRRPRPARHLRRAALLRPVRRAHRAPHGPARLGDRPPRAAVEHRGRRTTTCWPWPTRCARRRAPLPETPAPRGAAELPRSRSAAAVTSGCCATRARSAHPSLSPVVPNGHDQFDNGFRIDRLGLGRSIPQTAYRARGVARAIRSMLDDAGLRARCRDYSRRIDSDVALTRACELIESLARPNGGKRFV